MWLWLLLLLLLPHESRIVLPMLRLLRLLN